MAARARPDVRYQFYSRAGILPKVSLRYLTYFRLARRSSSERASRARARLSAIITRISCDIDVSARDVGARK